MEEIPVPYVCTYPFSGSIISKLGIFDATERDIGFANLVTVRTHMLLLDGDEQQGRAWALGGSARLLDCRN